MVQDTTVNVTLNAAPVPTITFNQNTFTICPGDVVDIDATINNPYDPGNITIDWQPTGETVEDIQVAPVIETWYYMNVNDGCYDIIDSVKVEIGTVNLTSITVNDATDCPGQVGFTPGSIDVLPDNPTWTYVLNGGGNPPVNQNSGSFPGLAGGVTYFINVTNDDGCSIDTAVTVGLGANAVTGTFVLDSVRDVTCFGTNDGGAYITDITGGITPPFDITWTHTTGIHFQETIAGMPGNPDSEVDDLYGGQWGGNSYRPRRMCMVNII